jgi:hypothetical protein
MMLILFKHVTGLECMKAIKLVKILVESGFQRIEIKIFYKLF